MNILITGGASGLGRAVVNLLSQEETNKIFFTYNHSLLQADEICQKNRHCESIHCDFNSSTSIIELLSKMEMMDLDVLINNAIPGLLEKQFHKLQSEEICRSFIAGVVPTLQITQKAITLFRKKKFGKIITILSSYLVGVPPVGMSEYVASKAYLHSMSKSWATENAKFNITSNSLSPSFMQTGLTKDVDSRIVEGMVERHPLNKLLTVNEAALSVQFLINATQQINGINLVINGASSVI